MILLRIMQWQCAYKVRPWPADKSASGPCRGGWLGELSRACNQYHSVCLHTKQTYLRVSGGSGLEHRGV
jgi:hypothetical protein